MIRIGSMFTGYGGLDLAVAAHYGGSVVWHAEIERAAIGLLEKRWPDVPNLGDVANINWSEVPAVDIITGGFPCQDVSHAGFGRGLRPGTRSGLWEYMAYAIDMLRPQRVIIENVKGLLSSGAHSDMEPCSWCLGDIGGQPALRALGSVLGTLADIGYDAQWSSVRASDAGAPHIRSRIFIVARTAADAGSR